MTTTLIAIGAGLGAGLLALLVLLMHGRTRRKQPDEDADHAATLVAALTERMSDLTLELGRAVDRAEQEARRSRFLVELSASLDLNDLLTRTLEAGTGLPGADAGLIAVRGQEERPIVATLGLSAEEAERQAALTPPENPEARAVTFSYRYGARREERVEDGEHEQREPPEPHERPIHAGLSVPMRYGEGEPAGFLTIFSRRREYVFSDETTDRLEELAVLAAPAIRNARRFREARHLADLDALTGLHNRRYFHETLAREVARAHRYDRALSLLVFDVDDFKDVNDRIGHLAGDAVLAELAQRVRDAIRSADIACRVGGDEFAVVLPESNLDDAEHVYRRIQMSVVAGSFGPNGTLAISAGCAELRSDDDAGRFFERADAAL